MFNSIFMIAGDENRTESYQVLQELGNVFEPIFNTHASSISDMLFLFGSLLGVLITLVSIFSVVRMNRVDSVVSENKTEINKLKTEVIERVNDIHIETKRDVDNLEKWLFQEIKDINRHREKAIEKLEMEIQYKIQNEIIYYASEHSKNVEKNAYQQLSYTMNTMRVNVENRLFNYQKLIYNINILKKREYDRVLEEHVDSDEKLKNMVKIQTKYNETNNITIPELLSDNIDSVISALKKLSEEEELKPIIINFFKDALNSNVYDKVDAYNIKYTLQSFYGYDYDKEIVALVDEGKD